MNEGGLGREETAAANSYLLQEGRPKAWLVPVGPAHPGGSRFRGSTPQQPCRRGQGPHADAQPAPGQEGRAELPSAQPAPAEPAASRRSQPASQPRFLLCFGSVGGKAGTSGELPAPRRLPIIPETLQLIIFILCESRGIQEVRKIGRSRHLAVSGVG